VCNMKFTRSFYVGLFICLSAVGAAKAENEYTANIVSYVNIPFSAGDNLIGNPLSNSTNDLNHIFSLVPTGSTFSPWDPSTRQYFPASTYYDGSGWSENYMFVPGEGALFHTPSTFTNTYVGGVLLGPGPGENPPIPPVLGAGLYLLSSLFPAADRSFQDIIGRDPREGESVTSLDAAMQTYRTTTYRLGSWDNGTPTLGIGQAAFYGLAPVPEPSSASLLIVGCAAALLLRRKA
jgi:hypothetical protein